MFRLLRVIIRPSSELIQNYLIPSAFCLLTLKLQHLTQSYKVSTCAQTERSCSTGNKYHPKVIQPPTVTTARGHWNETKRTVTTEYNSRRNLECCWFLVSKKHVKIRTFCQYKCYHILNTGLQFIVKEGDKKRLAYPVHKNFPINRYFIGLLTCYIVI